MPTPLNDSEVSVRLPNHLKDRIEAYAELTHRSKSYVTVSALTEYLDWRLPQIEDLKLAVAAADRGEFATEDEVAAALAGRPLAKKATVKRRVK